MIKSFKDFDSEFRGQEIYEAIDNVTNDENGKTFTEDDVVIPELISDNKFLLKISRIVLRKLEKSGLGNFSAHPVIIKIDGAPGVYFYNTNDPSMNIVICRDANGKSVYLFREFEFGTKNIADLVLTTTKLGFSDIIDEMISRLTPVDVEEGLINEWVEGSFKYTEKDVEMVANMPASVRQLIINLFKDSTANKVSMNIFNKSSVEPFATICAAINDIYGRINQSNIKKVIDIFDKALGKSKTPTEHEEVFNVLNDCRYGGGSAVISSSGIECDIEDGIGDVEELRDSELKEDTREYNETIEDIYSLASAMCKYVKSNGDFNTTDLSGLISRGMIITGKGGTGKSNAIYKALEDNHMVQNRDYFEMSSSSTAIKSLYKKFYDYNGKLLIFDDSGELFNTSYKQSFWKQALQTKQEQANVSLPQNTGTSNKTVTNNTYDVSKVKTRQQRYYLEIGQSSHDEYIKYRDSEFKKMKQKFFDDGGDHISFTKKIEADFYEIIDDAWNRMQEEKEPLMPETFNYKGVVIIISNESRDSFKKTVGEDNWGALMRRMTSFDLHPKPETMWVVIKEKLLVQRDTPETVLPDKLCMIPRDVVDEFIEEVENNFKNAETRDMNFSIIADNMNRVFSGPEGRSNWKRTLKRLMNTKK